VIHKLNELVRVCMDAQKGYKQAALEVHNPVYQKLFLATSSERGKFAFQLQDTIRKLGAKPARGGSSRGSLHRAWMNIRFGMNLHDDAVVFQECLRGEEKGLQEYQNIFWDKQFHDFETMLEKQYVQMIEMRDCLENRIQPEEPEQAGSVFHL
jgi:uncharacterized protein (TIGR02284 family)